MPKLALPAMEGLFADPVLLAHFNYSASGLVGLTQYTDLLPCCVSLAFHGLDPFLGSQTNSLNGSVFIAPTTGHGSF